MTAWLSPPCAMSFRITTSALVFRGSWAFAASSRRGRRPGSGRHPCRRGEDCGPEVAHGGVVGRVPIDPGVEGARVDQRCKLVPDDPGGRQLGGGLGEGLDRGRVLPGGAELHGLAGDPVVRGQVRGELDRGDGAGGQARPLVTERVDGGQRGDQRRVAVERRRPEPGRGCGVDRRQRREPGPQRARSGRDRPDLCLARADGRLEAGRVARHERGQRLPSLSGEHVHLVGKRPEVGRRAVEDRRDQPVGAVGQLGPGPGRGRVIQAAGDACRSERDHDGGDEPAQGGERSTAHRSSSIRHAECGHAAGVGSCCAFRRRR